VDGEERRVRTGVERGDSPQLPGGPVHADEMDAVTSATFGIRPDVEEVTVPLRLLIGRGTVGATPEPDETHHRRGEELATRRLASATHANSATIGTGTTIPRERWRRRQVQHDMCFRPERSTHPVLASSTPRE
jgi:hypothetical protein